MLQNYACYQDARFILVATPSGVRSRQEGAALHLIDPLEPLIGMAQDGLAAFEPAFVDELAAILAFGFEYMQKDGADETSERNWLRDETGGSIYLRLSTRPEVDEVKQTDKRRRYGRRLSTAPIGCASPGPTARSWSPTPARSRPRLSGPSA